MARPENPKQQHETELRHMAEEVFSSEKREDFWAIGGFDEARVSFEDVDFARREYATLATNASACLSCSGEPCASACIYGIDVSALCAPTHRMLA